jgi:hypothetical protein
VSLARTSVAVAPRGYFPFDRLTPRLTYWTINKTHSHSFDDATTPPRFFVVIAFAGVISGIFLVAFIMLAIHLHILRRKARARARANSTSSPNTQQQQQQQQDASRRRRPRPRRCDRDHDHDRNDDESEDHLTLEKSTTSFSVSSLSLEPNQPIFVDVVVVEESSVHHGGAGAGDGAQTGLQFILTPPTPGR